MTTKKIQLTEEQSALVWEAYRSGRDYTTQLLVLIKTIADLTPLWCEVPGWVACRAVAAGLPAEMQRGKKRTQCNYLTNFLVEEATYYIREEDRDRLE